MNTMVRRTFLAALSLISGGAVSTCARGGKRPLSQWQWRAKHVGDEVEQTVKRALSKCDIGRGRGTVSLPPARHNCLHVWVDMDDDMVMAARQKLGWVPDHFQTRTYAVATTVQEVLMSTESDFVKSLQKALDAAKRQCQARTWRDGLLAPDSYKGMVQLSDYLPKGEK